MIRRLSILGFALATLLARAQETQPTLTSEGNLDISSTVWLAAGKAVLRDVGLLVTANEIRYEVETGVITATGDVVYTRGPMRLLADQVTMQRRTNTYTARRVRAGSYPYYIQGESANGSREEVTIFKARISYGEPGPWQPTANADQITLSSTGRRIRTEGAQVGIGHVQPLPFPRFQQNLSDPLLSFVRLTGGYRGSLGAFLDAGIHLPVAPGLRLGGDVGYYTERGVMAGPSGTYRSDRDPEELHGFFRSGYINDHGDKGVDILGRRVPESRGFLEWEHQQTLSDGLTLTGQLNWWRDSEVVRDFRPRAFFPVQQPDTFLEATYTTSNTLVSVFGRFEPNSFENVQQRVPEIRLDVLPLAVGNGFYERFNASVAMLHERPLSPFTGPATATIAGSGPGAVVARGFGVPMTVSPASEGLGRGDVGTWETVSPLPFGPETDLRTTRMDAYYGLSRPIAPADWLTLTPVAGGRVTHYMNTHGARHDGSYTRVLGEIGADAELRSSGTFAYQNTAWQIDGLRHLFTPRISYRYIPKADRGSDRIPRIDRQTFSTYLQPLGLGDMRSIDELQARNTLRLSLNNALQTRDAKDGVRDLLLVNVAEDFRFKRQPGERDASEIHTELAAMPARWLELGLYNSFAPQSFTLREFNTGITLRNGNAWTVRFANNFLRRELEDYLIDGRARVNEQFDALAILRYDQRKHRFTEQSYGVVQNLANTWRISYVVSFYSGRRRESSFGFSVQIDTVRF